MRQHGFDHAIAELVEAAAIKADITDHRLALEWSQALLTRAVQLWDDIEAHEALAYEDKIAAQINLLDQASGSLWHLQKTLSHNRRVLRRHRRHIRH
jgi:hypothetical protein